MTLARSVAEIVRDHVTLEVEGIDRMYLNAVVPILQTERGMLFVGKAQEKASVFRTERRKNPTTGASCAWLYRSTAMVNQYYLYALDRDFGPFFLKFCSYFPFNAKLCINGHERQLEHRDISTRRSTMGSSPATTRPRCRRSAKGSIPRFTWTTRPGLVVDPGRESPMAGRRDRRVLLVAVQPGLDPGTLAVGPHPGSHEMPLAGLLEVSALRELGTYESTRSVERRHRVWGMRSVS